MPPLLGSGLVSIRRRVVAGGGSYAAPGTILFSTDFAPDTDPGLTDGAWYFPSGAAYMTVGGVASLKSGSGPAYEITGLSQSNRLRIETVVGPTPPTNVGDRVRLALIDPSGNGYIVEMTDTVVLTKISNAGVEAELDTAAFAPANGQVLALEIRDTGIESFAGGASIYSAANTTHRTMVYPGIVLSGASIKTYLKVEATAG